MTRIILLVALIAVLYYVIKRIAASWHPNNVPNPAQKRLVQCNRCGTHIPESEGIVIHGQYYCNNPQCNPESTQNTPHDD